MATGRCSISQWTLPDVVQFPNKRYQTMCNSPEGTALWDRLSRILHGLRWWLSRINLHAFEQKLELCKSSDFSPAVFNFCLHPCFFLADTVVDRYVIFGSTGEYINMLFCVGFKSLWMGDCVLPASNLLYTGEHPFAPTAGFRQSYW